MNTPLCAWQRLSTAEVVAFAGTAVPYITEQLSVVPSRLLAPAGSGLAVRRPILYSVFEYYGCASYFDYY